MTSRVLVVVNEMKRHEKEFNVLLVIKKILQCFHEKLNFIVVSIKELKDLEEMIIDEVMSTLQTNKERLLKKK